MTCSILSSGPRQIRFPSAESFKWDVFRRDSKSINCCMKIMKTLAFFRHATLPYTCLRPFIQMKWPMQRNQLLSQVLVDRWNITRILRRVHLREVFRQRSWKTVKKWRNRIRWRHVASNGSSFGQWPKHFAPICNHAIVHSEIQQIAMLRFGSRFA